MIVGGEPALLIAGVTAGLGLLVTFGFGLSAGQAGAIVAIISAVFAAAVTRPGRRAAGRGQWVV
ncbi:hypothetical protein ABTZ21_08080 [Streptomyces sp. NPDC096191]|uniref:hypothetical protein n=1 Tax=Streptomyces sp. NPDC096191 TaxID=3155426 RepID=UPI003321CCF7